MTDLAIDRVRVKVGYVSPSVAKISVVTFNDKPVSASCSGGSVSVGALAPQGASIVADFPAFTHVCHTGLITITGLNAGKRYTYSVSHAGETLSGSFTTPPANDAYAVICTTCEFPQGRVMPLPWTRIRAYVEAHSPQVIARMHIDDNWYFDVSKIANFNSGMLVEPETGLQQTGVPQTTMKEHDYVVAWATWYGMFPRWFTYPDNPDRQWLMRNLASWNMFGDHEFYGDAHSHVDDGTASGKGVIPTIDAFAGNLWAAFLGDAGPPKLRAGEHYWGMTVGPATWGALDRVTHAQPYDACNAGNTFSYGAADSGWYVTLSGNQGSTDPSLTALGLPNNVKTTDYLGATQVADFISHFTSSAAPFKCMCSSVSITAHNQPWYDWHPEDWLTYIQGIFASNNCNGVAGKYFHVIGDVHSPWVRDFTANGTTGLGLTGIASGVMWEFNSGTVNGSGIGGLNRTVAQGGRYRGTVVARSVTGDRGDGVFTVLDVSPTEITATLVYSHTLQICLGPYNLKASQNDNAFAYAGSPQQLAI